MNLAKSLLAGIALFLFLTPTLRAQQRGWGDTWTHPGSVGERAQKQAVERIAQKIRAKKFAEADKDLSALVRHSPENPGLRMLGIAVHAAMHRYDEALADCAEALRLVQKYAPAAVGEVLNSRALVYAMMGKPAQSRADFERAIRSDRRNIEFANNLAWLLATSPDASVRDGKEAVRHARTAAALGNYHDAATLDTLAAAEAESGDFAAAAKYERSAISLWKGKPSHGGDKRLLLYEKHQAYREKATPERLLAD